MAGTAVGITGGHGHQFGLEADGPDALVTATRRVVRDGADVVKVVASEAAMLTTTGLAPGRMVHGAPELTEAELRAVVATAAELGVRVMSHAQDSESVRRSAVAGVTSVEHAWLADRAAIEALAASGGWLVPTLVVTDVNRTLPGLTAVERERQDLIERRHRASTEAAIELGVRLATGTDTGEVGVTADLVWREIALLHDHGASAMTAIQAATSSAARLLGVEAETGTHRGREAGRPGPRRGRSTRRPGATGRARPRDAGGPDRRRRLIRPSAGAGPGSRAPGRSALDLLGREPTVVVDEMGAVPSQHVDATALRCSPRTRTIRTAPPSRTARSYMAMSGSWSMSVNEIVRRRRATSPFVAPVPSRRSAPSSPRRTVTSAARRPAVMSSAAAPAAPNGSRNAASRRSVG